MGLTIPAALAFKPVPGLDQEASKEVTINHAEEVVIKSESPSPGKLCASIWLPNLNQIFIWKILKNPLFLVLTFSVITGR